jgi:nucleotide-binding universal stress UspA family protein
MYTKILYAADLNSEHTHLTEKAVAIAKLFHATLYLLHVIELPTSIQLAQSLGFAELAHPAKDDARTVLSLIGERYLIPEEQQFVEIGSVKEQLFKKVKELDCQLIILGNHAPDGFPFLLGSTAHATLNHAPCDIMTLKV